MPLIPMPLNSQVQLTFWGLLANQVIMSTFRYQFVGVPNPGTDYRTYLGDFAVQVEAIGGMQEKYIKAVPTNMTVTRKTVQIYFPLRLRYIESIIGEAGLATTGSANTANIAASIKRVGETIGPRGVGRVQIPATRTGVVNGTLDPTYIAADLVGLADQLRQQIVGLDADTYWEPVLFGTTGGVGHTTPIIGSAVEPTARVMRRRTVGLGI